MLVHIMCILTWIASTVCVAMETSITLTFKCPLVAIGIFPAMPFTTISWFTSYDRIRSSSFDTHACVAFLVTFSIGPTSATTSSQGHTLVVRVTDVAWTTFTETLSSVTNSINSTTAPAPVTWETSYQRVSIVSRIANTFSGSGETASSDPTSVPTRSTSWMTNSKGIPLVGGKTHTGVSP